MPELDRYSRFLMTQEVLVDQNRTFGRWQPPRWLVERPDEADIRTFQVTSPTEGRPDLISQAVYNTPLLDWVLIAFNGVQNPLNWPRAGSLIEYPVDTIVLPEFI